MNKEFNAFQNICMNLATIDKKHNKEFLENAEIVEKGLKALEIIRAKRVDCKSLVECNSVEEYNELWFDVELTQEEYDLLKEVLNENTNG